MKVFRIALMAVSVLLCAISSQAQARPVPAINYQREFNESDLVVIATSTTRPTDTNERSFILNIYRPNKDGKQVPVQSIGVETRFRVSLVLKGEKSIKQFTLHHYRVADPAMCIVNGPMLVSFIGPSDFDSSNARGHNSYLLFLVRESDGRYAPTGGQKDPGYEAIHPLPYEPN
jgi:hypothetical protein